MNQIIYKKIIESKVDFIVLKKYNGKITLLNEYFDEILKSEDFSIKNEIEKCHLELLSHIEGINYSWEKILYEFNDSTKLEQEETTRLRNELGIKYFLIYQALYSDFKPKEKLRVVRNVAPLIKNDSTFYKCIIFEDSLLLEKINGKIY